MKFLQIAQKHIVWIQSYVTAKFTSLYLNLIIWTAFLWTSSIAQVFDFLTFDVLHKKWHNDVAHEVAYNQKR